MPSTVAINDRLRIAGHAAAIDAESQSTAGTSVGFALYDAQGTELAGSAGAPENYGASVTKVLLLIAYLGQHQTGVLGSVAVGELQQMIEQSSNAAADWVYDHLRSPVVAVGRVVADAQLPGFVLDTSDPVYVLGQSEVTAQTLAKLFAELQRLLPATRAALALDLLSHPGGDQQNGFWLAGLPGTVYEKEGWKPEADGLPGAPYVVNQAAQFTFRGERYGIAVTVGGTEDQASGASLAEAVALALVGHL